MARTAAIAPSSPVHGGASKPLKADALVFAIGCAWAGLACAAMMMPNPAWATTTLDDTLQRDYAIPAGKLSDALALFAATAGVPLSFDPHVLASLHSDGLQGRYTIREGFARLLAGSGYGLVTAGNGGYSLRQTAPTSGEASRLPVVEVTARAERSVTTEGTGSYTTEATTAATGLAIRLRETPQSVSVITRQRLDDLGATTVAEALRNTAGIAAPQLDSERTTFSARGFSIDDFQYDGISTYYKSNYAAGESELDSVIYDRIEIVRGATGLLTGAGQPSASINLVRKRADSRIFKGSATISAGSWDQYRGSADLSAPLAQDGRVRARIVAAHEDKGLFTNGYKRKTDVLYGVIEADLTPATTLSVGGSYQKNEVRGLTYGGVPLWYSDGTPTRFNRSFSIWPGWTFEDAEITNTFVNLDHQFDNGWIAKARLGHSRSEVDNARLFVWGYPDHATGVVSDEPSIVRFPGSRKQTSIDVKLSGPLALAGRNHEAILGLSHSDHKYAFDWIGAATPWVPTRIDALRNYPEPRWDWANAELSEKNHTKQTAFYAAARLSLADPLKLILGGRFNKIERDGAGWASSGAYDYTKSKFIPYVGLVYDLNSTYSAYASYTGIFTPQDYRDRNGNWLEPVTGKAYETGIKGEFFSGKLDASVALFRIEQDKLGQQDTGHMVPGTTTPAYYPTEGATSTGIDMELTGQLTPGWNLSFSASHFEAKDARHQKVNTNMPRTLLRLFTTYRLPGEWNKLTVGGGANWQSHAYYDNQGPNGEAQKQSDYLVASLMARYQFSPQVSLQLNVNNVFDKTYQTAINWYGQATWGAPRNVLATLKYRF